MAPSRHMIARQRLSPSACHSWPLPSAICVPVLLLSRTTRPGRNRRRGCTPIVAAGIAHLPFSHHPCPRRLQDQARGHFRIWVSRLAKARIACGSLRGRFTSVSRDRIMGQVSMETKRGLDIGVHGNTYLGTRRESTLESRGLIHTSHYVTQSHRNICKGRRFVAEGGLLHQMTHTTARRAP